MKELTQDEALRQVRKELVAMKKAPVAELVLHLERALKILDVS